jgi:phenylalanyl-tRNA synthetase beta chain
VDREATDLGASRGAQLIARWAGGEVLAGVAAAGAAEPRRWISIRPSRAGQVLGFEVSDATATEVFDELGMAWRHEGGAVAVEVPGYRVDIDREVDLIEEVARVVGYDHVGSRLPRSAHAGGLPEGFAFAWRVKDALVAAGLREIRPVPFVSAADVELTGDTDAVVVANPLRAEEGFLRTRLLPGLVRAVARNRAAGVRSVALFEVGTVFRLADPTDERRMIGFVLNGEAAQGWSQPDRPFDALDARGVLEELFETLGVHGWSLEDGLEGPFHPGRSAWVTIEGARAGTIGELHPRVAADLDIEGRVAVVELEFDTVRAASAGTFRYRDVPRFPPVRRDLAFVVPIDAPAGAVTDELRRAGGELLDRAALFDVYTGDAVPEGTRSLAFGVDLRASDRTLTDDEADEVVGAIVEALAARFGAVLRSGSD